MTKESPAVVGASMQHL